MLQNYLKIAWRNLWGQKTYSALNVVGLTAALTSALLIAFYVGDEFSYNAFHEKADRIARVAQIYEDDGDGRSDFYMPGRALPLFEEIPEIEDVVRMSKAREPVMRTGDILYQSDAAIYATENFFDVFTHPFLAGDPQTALVQPYSIVLSKTVASRIFGDEPAVGQVLSFFQNDPVYKFEDQTFTVTGVIEDVPQTTSFNFDVVLPVRANPSVSPEEMSAATFLLLREGAALSTVQDKVDELETAHLQSGMHLHLQPITDVHLDPPLDREWIPGGGGGDMQSLLILISVGLFLILIASVNYVNLATARAARRTREIGVRKVAGASRAQLVAQHLGESLGVSLAATGLSVGLALILLPTLNHVTGKAMSADYLLQPTVVLSMTVGGILIGILSGIYPALYLTKVSPVEMLKDVPVRGSGGHRFRSALVVGQFTLSVAMIAFAVVVYRQIDYIQNKDFGFDGEHVVVVDNTDQLGDRQRPFLEEAKRLSQVVEAGFVQTFPGRLWRLSAGTFYETAPDLAEPAEAAGGMSMDVYYGDDGFLPTMGIALTAGRNFRLEGGGDSLAIIINRAAVDAMGWDDPLNQALYQPSYTLVQDESGGWQPVRDVARLEVIGVMEDFHHYPVQQRIEPMAVKPRRTGLFSAVFRFAPGDISGALASLEDVYMSFDPTYPFETYFVDDHFAVTYQRDVGFGTMAAFFTALSVLIACVGMIGLAAFTAERRTKEVGIRKVLGASIRDVLVLLCKDTVAWVVIACIIGLPLGYLAIHRWLENFAYRIDVTVAVFVLAGASALLFALLSVVTQTFRAATANPVDSLRDD